MKFRSCCRIARWTTRASSSMLRRMRTAPISLRAVWGPEFFGELPVVNGAIYPYLNVEPRSYRLRVLNGANSRFFNLYFNLANHATDIPSLVTFHQIGTDGGFLASPAALNKLLLAPAERADLIVDFSGLEGKTVTLSNDAPAPFPGWDHAHAQHAPLYELMQFRVTLPASSTGKSFSMPSPISLPRTGRVPSIATQRLRSLGAHRYCREDRWEFGSMARDTTTQSRSF